MPGWGEHVTAVRALAAGGDVRGLAERLRQAFSEPSAAATGWLSPSTPPTPSVTVCTHVNAPLAGSWGVAVHPEIDRYAHLDSFLHRWDPRWKLASLGPLLLSFAAAPLPSAPRSTARSPAASPTP